MKTVLRSAKLKRSNAEKISGAGGKILTAGS